MTQYDDIQSQMDAVLVGAVVEKTVFDGETATVTVGVPGMQVWQTVRPGLGR